MKAVIAKRLGTPTAAEIKRLDRPLPAVFSVDKVWTAAGSAAATGETTRFPGTQDFEDGTAIFWWAVWEESAEADPQGYEIVSLPPCPQESELELCVLPAGHRGDHRFD